MSSLRVFVVSPICRYPLLYVEFEKDIIVVNEVSSRHIYAILRLSYVHIMFRLYKLTRIFMPLSIYTYLSYSTVENIIFDVL